MTSAPGERTAGAAAVVYRPSTGLGSIDAARYTRPLAFRPLLDRSRGLGVAEHVTAVASEGGGEAEIDPIPDHALVLVLHSRDKTWDANIDGRPLRMRATTDTAMFVPAGTSSRWRTFEGVSSVLHLCIEPDWFHGIADETGDGVPANAGRFSVGPVDPRLGALLRRMHRSLTAAAPHERLFGEQAGVIAGIEILRVLGGAERARSRRYALSPACTARVKAFIEDNLSRDIGLAEIAEVARLSRFHFARAFRAETGMSPHRWLVHRRCERAKRLMAETDLSLADVALACGFAHQAHFTNAFHRTIGTTPGRWRTGAR
jgi:AraC-like DNA-binding protein